MDLSINYNQAQDAASAYQLAENEVTPEYVKKYGVNADVNKNAAGKELTAKGKGFELRIKFLEDHCEVFLELSFMLRPFKGKVLEGIEKKLKKTV